MVLCAIAASLALPAPTVDDVTGRLLGAMLDATGPVALAAGVIGWLFWMLLVRMNPFGTGPSVKLWFLVSLSFVILIAAFFWPTTGAEMLVNQQMDKAVAASEGGSRLPNSCVQHVAIGQVERIWEDKAETYVTVSPSVGTLKVPSWIADGLVVGERYQIVQLLCTNQVWWATRTKSVWSVEPAN